MITSTMFPIRCFLLRWKQSTRLAIDPWQFPVEIEGFTLQNTVIYGQISITHVDLTNFEHGFDQNFYGESNGGFLFGGITGGTWFILVLPTFFTGLDWLVCGWPASQSSGSGRGRKGPCGSVDVTCWGHHGSSSCGDVTTGSMELGLLTCLIFGYLKWTRSNLR